MHHLLFYPLLENQITIVFWLNLNVTMFFDVDSDHFPVLATLKLKLK